MNNLHTIIVEEGMHINAINKTLEFMRQSEIYDFNGRLVTIENNKLLPHDRQLLKFWLANRIQYVEAVSKKKGLFNVKVNPDITWVDQIISLGSHRQLKPIKAFITAPILKLDGSIINKPGYDISSQLYFDDSKCDVTQVNIIENPSTAELKQALHTLMAPFEGFPVASDLDRSVLLAAILTAIMRPVLSICPGFGFDAPTPGTGKTLLAQTVAQLMLTESQTLTTYAAEDSRGDAENRKRVFSSLITSDRCILIDNIQKPFDSLSLATLTTASDYSDRILGKSESRTFPVKMLVLLTGNNLRFSKDLNRRFPVVRIDAKSEHLQGRKFPFDPKDYIKKNRLQLISAGLTLIKGWLNTTEYKTRKLWKDREIRSYSGDWDEFVGQTIAWLADQEWSCENGKSQFTDTALAFAGKSQSNPETEALYDLLLILKSIFKGQSFTAKDVLLKSLMIEHRDLAQSLMEQNLSTPLNAVSIGKLFGYRKDQIINGSSIQAQPMRQKTSVWKIKSTLPNMEKGLLTKSP
jgi:hypothetical protein